jgi:hypothetical protein
MSPPPPHQQQQQQQQHLAEHGLFAADGVTDALDALTLRPRGPAQSPPLSDSDGGPSPLSASPPLPAAARPPASPHSAPGAGLGAPPPPLQLGSMAPDQRAVRRMRAVSQPAAVAARASASLFGGDGQATAAAAAAAAAGGRHAEILAPELERASGRLPIFKALCTQE